METIYFEILHILSHSVYSYSEEVLEGSELWLDFQLSSDPTKLGFRFEREYSSSEDINNQTNE